MKDGVLLVTTSLLAILFFTLHQADDIVRGFEPGGFTNVRAVLTVTVWLYGTLVLSERRSGHVITLLGAVLGCIVPLAHMRGAGVVGGRIANSSGILFWVWTLFALGVTASFSALLSARGLWKVHRRTSDIERLR
jgi:hypothetical protein